MGFRDAKILGCTNVIILDSDNVFWDNGELWEIKDGNNKRRSS